MKNRSSIIPSKKLEGYLVEKQVKIWRKVKSAAGPRYTAGLNVELPIRSFFDGIGRTEDLFLEIESLCKMFQEAFKAAQFIKKQDYFSISSVEKDIEAIHCKGKDLYKSVVQLSRSRNSILNLDDLVKKSKKLEDHFYPVSSAIYRYENEETEREKNKAKEENREYFGHTRSKELEALKGIAYRLDNLYREVRNIRYFAESGKARLANDPVLLILGEAGMGKTHLVCDETNYRISKKLPPTIIVLGEELVSVDDPLNSIFLACGIKEDKKKVLECLNSLGKRRKKRSLIIVDAINEADIAGWKKNVRNLVKEIKSYPWIGLVMTCRDPFQYLALPKRFRPITTWHNGFSEYELEAMSTFFKFYKIPLPEVPLLISEFRSPLFLSSFCKTAKSIRGGAGLIAKNLKDIAQGQAGMTKVLEDYYKAKEKEIIKKFGSKYKAVIKYSGIWNKTGNNCLIKKVAAEMSNKGKRYLESGAVVNIIRDLSGARYSVLTCQKILNILVVNGVLIKDVAWNKETDKYFDVIKFSFHKFSDHIIARHLLDQYFNPNNISGSLLGNNPLGEIFKSEDTIQINVDLVEAVMVEFPERIKRNKRQSNRELVDYLPKDLYGSIHVARAYLSSLYWRKPQNFKNEKSQIKKSIIDYFNKVALRYLETTDDLFNLLIATGLKPYHPLHSKRFDRYLSGMSIASRDLIWGEFIRKGSGADSPRKLVSWIESNDISGMDAKQANCAINILGWLLVTNDRLLRDRVTRCIYIIGKIHPKVCFDVALQMVKENDPYIAERILAASYGVCMARHNRSDKEFHNALKVFARKIYSHFFKVGAEHATTHFLIRGYARGIIEIARLYFNDLLTIRQFERITPPYEGGPRKWGRSKDVDVDDYRGGNAPMDMDFENYTVGGLIPDRNNYDSKNKEFIKVKEKIFWRIYQLGYSLQKFGKIDKEIAQNSQLTRGDYIGKVDRYGKKYCWIAYYEMLGLRADQGKLREWMLTEDGRMEFPELDPSFPAHPFNPRLYKHDLTRGRGALKKWLAQKKAPEIIPYLEVEEIDGNKGPWVLVGGSLGGENKKTYQHITTFVNTFLVPAKQLEKIEEFFQKNKHFGNEIPSLPEVRGVFAGELGWREIKSKEYTKRAYIRLKRGERKVKIPKRFNLVMAEWTQALYGNEKKKQVKPLEYRIEAIYEKVPVEIISRWFSSKDYSKMERGNDIGLNIPSGNLIKRLNLRYLADSFDFVDRKAKKATLSIVTGNVYGTHENLLYLRKDLLDKYLKQSKKELCMIAWGERQYRNPSNLGIRKKDITSMYQKYRNIYKELFVYSSSTFKKVL